MTRGNELEAPAKGLPVRRAGASPRCLSAQISASWCSGDGTCNGHSSLAAIWRLNGSSELQIELDSYTYNRQGRLWLATLDKTGSGGGVTSTEHEYSDAGIRVAKTVDEETGTGTIPPVG